MKKKNVQLELNCPSCGHPLDDFLVKNFENSIRKDLEAELSRRESELKSQREEFNQMSLQLVKDKEALDKMVEQRVQGQIISKEAELKESIAKQINEEKALQLQELENELIKKSNLLREMNQNKAKLVALQREMEERETKIILEKENELSQRLAEARKTIQEQTEQENNLKMREREKVIEDLKAQLNIAKQKAEQGSMQLQGAVQEREIISILQELHPFDELIQSKTGSNAADVLHNVITSSGVKVGSIYIESKRTKQFQPAWIPKLKEDNLRMGADIILICSSALPDGIDRYGLVDGVWVCDLNSLKELSVVLRYALIKIHQEKTVNQHSQEKMGLLYQYLTSNEFRNLFSSILENYKALEESHKKEQTLLQRMWAQRAKQLEQILVNSVQFWGSIKGIAGDSIPEIKMLEIPKAS